MKRSLRRVLFALLAVVIVIVGSTWGYRAFQKAVFPLKYEEYVTKYAAEYGLPPSLVYAVIHTESHFDPEAESGAGAKGLMQLVDGTYEWVQTLLPGEPEPPERVYDPEVNIRCGCKVLQVVMEQFEVKETALAAYNAGSGNVAKWLKNPDYSDDGVTLKEIPFEETRNYVKRVLKAQELYQTMYNTDGEDL